MKSNVRVIVSGGVQGVWFRAKTKEKAEQLGVTGWVRNTSSGKVEAVFEGEQEQIKEMLNWCHHGPPMAHVENVEIKNQELTNGFDSFSIRY